MAKAAKKMIAMVDIAKTMKAEDLQKFVLDQARVDELQKELKATLNSVKEQEVALIAQYKDGFVIPSAFAVLIEEAKRRNVSWKNEHGLLAVKLGMDAEVEQERIMEATTPTVTEKIIVKRR